MVQPNLDDYAKLKAKLGSLHQQIEEIVKKNFTMANTLIHWKQLSFAKTALYNFHAAKGERFAPYNLDPDEWIDIKSVQELIQEYRKQKKEVDTFYASLSSEQKDCLRSS